MDGVVFDGRRFGRRRRDRSDRELEKPAREVSR
jgi:hypothetical protein